jgi:energy-coupling factor transporter ATP-binding protein EcfA2
MSLVKLSYSEYKDDPKYWEISDATFTNINLIVGKNSSGKSRLMSIVNSLARLLSGNQPIPYEKCKFSVNLNLNNSEFLYEIEFKESAVFSETLKVNGDEKLSRGEDGVGKIRYEKLNDSLEFKLPPDVVAAVNRRDEIQHPFLIELHKWANSIVLYSFGTDFGRSQLMGISDTQALFNGSAPAFDDPSNVVKVYTLAFTKYKDKFDKAILKDMNKLGYAITDVGTENLQAMMNFPVAAITMYTVEKDLGFKNPQTQLSQGMWRALALVTHLNSCTFSKSKQLILIDDIGEGLDYERSVAIIDLLISKAKINDIQLLMTSNDRFVMNEVPLEYWSVLKRKKGIVKMFNLLNSKKQFDKFKYIGLSNFDFFASDFFESEAAND